MSKAVMIDLETMGLDTRAPIVSIAAYMFDTLEDDSDGLDETKLFYTGIDLKSNEFQGRHADFNAIMFWLGAPEDARRALMDVPKQPLLNAIQKFAQWLYYTVGEDATIWSHENFDVPILMTAYEDTNLKVPWNYRAPRDIRTIIEAAYGRNLDMEDEITDFPANPHPHDPRYDAWHQALMVQRCFRDLSKDKWLP